MTVQNSATLKSYFQTGDQPTQTQFGDQIDTIFLGTPLDGGTSTGGVNIYNFDVDSDLTAFAVGQKFSVIAHQTNSGAPTCSINGITPLSITKNGTTALAAGDITLSAVMLLYYDGGQLQLTNPSTSTSTGTVSSVGLTAPSDLFAVAGTPITSSGTLAITKASQTANTVFAGPASGSPDIPTMRVLQPADLPTATTVAQGAVQLATAAVTKAAASTSMPAAVGTMASHPGVAKAWVNFVGNGSIGACTINASYNVTSVTKTTTGTYTIVFTTAFSDADYVIFPACETNTSNNLGQINESTPPTTGQCSVRSVNGSNGALGDNPRMHVTFFGNF